LSFTVIATLACFSLLCGRDSEASSGSTQNPKGKNNGKGAFPKHCAMTIKQCIITLTSHKCSADAKHRARLIPAQQRAAFVRIT
jgi:hypothetical protein